MSEVAALARVQMIGTQRSGSNLLRLILDAHSLIAAPPSAHELRDFLGIQELYRPLSDDQNLHDLVRDMCELVRLNALEWPSAWLAEDEVARRVGHRSVAGAVLALYDHAASVAGATAWVSKCLENARHADDLLAASPDMMFLHLVRDPRDVALSFARAPIGPKDATIIALGWQEDQLIAESLRRRIPTANWIEIRFEDLVSNSARTLRPLLSRLNLDWEDGMLNYHRDGRASTAASLSPLWTNLDRQVDASRRGAFQRELEEMRPFIHSVEETSFKSMRFYGYEATSATGEVVLDRQQLEAAQVRDRELRIQMSVQSQSRDQSMHTRRDDFLRQLTQARAGVERMD